MRGQKTVDVFLLWDCFAFMTEHRMGCGRNARGIAGYQVIRQDDQIGGFQVDRASDAVGSIANQGVIDDVGGTCRIAKNATAVHFTGQPDHLVIHKQIIGDR